MLSGQLNRAAIISSEGGEDDIGNGQSFQLERFHRLVFVFALLFYSVTAWFSVGYHHADEHYQIIEFAGIKNGTNSPEHMPWEYHAKIRPALQPYIALAVFSIADGLNFNDPYFKAFLLRLLTGIIAVLIIRSFISAVRGMDEVQHQKWFIALSYFLWFLPFIYVRFSAETWSSLLLLFALSLIIKRGPSTMYSHLGIGLLLGFALVLRSQLVFSLVGLYAWLALVSKIPMRSFVLIVVGTGISVCMGVCMDSLFYEELTVVPWEYFKANLLEGKAASFGTSSWYTYVHLIFRYAFFPIGSVILLALLTLIIKRPKHVVVWVIVPFLVGHSLIGHKELRFLFPVACLIPWVLVLAWQEIAAFRNGRNTHLLVRVVLVGLVCVNCTALIIASLQPAGRGRVSITEKIHELRDGEKGLTVIYTKDNNPFSPWGITTNFYREEDAEFFPLELATNRVFKEEVKPLFLICTLGELDDEGVQNLIQREHLTEVHRGVPAWSNWFMHVYGFKTSRVLVLLASG